MDTINEDVLVNGTSCSIKGARIHGSVLVSNGGQIIVEHGAKVDGDIKLRSAGQIFFFSREGTSKKTTINGVVEDFDGSGGVLVCGDVIFNRDVRFVNRVGNIEIGAGDCIKYDPVFHGVVNIENGNGLTAFKGVKKSPRSISISNRSGTIFLEKNAPMNSVLIQDCGTLLIEDCTVYHRMDLHKNGNGLGGVVNLKDVRSFDKFSIQGSTSIVLLTNVRVSNEAELKGNSRGVVTNNSTFNQLLCERNAMPPFVFTKTEVTRGSGQCKDL